MASTERCLLVVDLQLASVQLPLPTYDAEGLLSRTELLLEGFRKAGRPILFIQHCGPVGHPFEKGTSLWPLHPRLGRRPEEPVIEKSNPDAFHGTELEAILRNLGVRELVICGFASQACVDTTVRSAFARGYQVTLVSDAHSTTDNEVLTAKQTIDFENFVLKRFSRLQKAEEVEA